MTGHSTETEVLIVGGGGAGCATALHLAWRKVPCVLLERGFVGSQASGVNYGGVRQQGRDPAELPLARRAREFWGRLEELIGEDCEFAVTGHLKLARSDKEEAELIAYAETARAHGIALRVIGRNAIHEEYPFLGKAVVAGSYCAEDGQANPRLLSPALARAARKAGADIRENATVVEIARDGARFAARTADGAEVRARVLVNTAGAWGAEISARFGEPVPLEVIAPNMAVTEPLPYFLKLNLGVCGGDVYARQIPRGNVIFGGGRGDADAAALRARPLPEITLGAMRRAAAIVPRLAGATVIRTWTGIEGNMPDDLPVMGPSRTTPGLFHAFGFSGHGFALGPGVGAVMAELAVDGRTTTPIAAFDVGRFTGARFAPATASAAPV
jgi:sarcosine oxidase subunit beta